jgi:hypothetical protein
MQPSNPCLACQFSAIIFQHPFRTRFQEQLNLWLTNDESETDAHELETTQLQAWFNQHLRDQDLNSLDQKLLQLRNQSIENSFHPLKRNTNQSQTKIIFENLTLLQQDIQKNCSPTNQAKINNNDCAKMHAASAQQGHVEEESTTHTFEYSQQSSTQKQQLH